MFSAMNVRSLGIRTDLIFQRFGGVIVDRGSYLVLLTPSNPAYRWGNMLLFADPPGEGDLERWRQLFAREVGAPPEINHMVFAWDTIHGETGYVQPFLDTGFEIERNVVLSTDAVHPPPRINDGIAISPLESDAEWQAAFELELLCRDEGEDEAGYRTFIERKMAQYREMIAAGMGRWFGAFLNGKLVADMGLFVEDGIGRFQSVKTHPGYRRRGICGTMVHAIARRGLETMGAETLVMIADAEYHAAKIYQSVGFRPTERIVGVERK